MFRPCKISTALRENPMNFSVGLGSNRVISIRSGSFASITRSIPKLWSGKRLPTCGTLARRTHTASRQPSIPPQLSPPIGLIILITKSQRYTHTRAHTLTHTHTHTYAQKDNNVCQLQRQPFVINSH